MSHRTFIESSAVTTAFWLDQYGGRFASIFRRCPPSMFWGQCFWHILLILLHCRKYFLKWYISRLGKTAELMSMLSTMNMSLKAIPDIPRWQQSPGKLFSRNWLQWRNRQGQSAPQRLLTGKFLLMYREKRKGWKLRNWEEKKENYKREVGKVLKKRWGLFFSFFFFFFLLFTFENDGNLFWVYQNGTFQPGKSISRREKNQEKLLCPLRNICLLRPWLAGRGHMVSVLQKLQANDIQIREKLYVFFPLQGQFHTDSINFTLQLPFTGRNYAAWKFWVGIAWLSKSVVQIYGFKPFLHLKSVEISKNSILLWIILSPTIVLTLNCIRYPALPLVHGTPPLRKPLSHRKFLIIFTPYIYTYHNHISGKKI